MARGVRPRPLWTKPRPDSVTRSPGATLAARMFSLGLSTKTRTLSPGLAAATAASPRANGLFGPTSKVAEPASAHQASSSAMSNHGIVLPRTE